MVAKLVKWFKHTPYNLGTAVGVGVYILANGDSLHWCGLGANQSTYKQCIRCEQFIPTHSLTPSGGAEHSWTIV